jgi:hypothetical protein
MVTLYVLRTSYINDVPCYPCMPVATYTYTGTLFFLLSSSKKYCLSLNDESS